ncbi:FxsA family protein [Allobranchiibius sp. CTAmp26]|uniref:FxsA family protein n=1 Tax=Allobranchiibius sp. CTAmp26 TaxID=2815214 RepID=UPI001AA0FE70|nr:FxsA family protein [Allobranchiibius sp. CTAmp26]MBO1754656.1 FxsA family protein [Allobranchiibius sp. CTAmp26]
MTTVPRRRTPWLRWVPLMLLVAAVCEIAVIVAVARAIGGWQTLGLLVLCSLLGAWLVRREWSGAWRHLREALRTGAMPADELADAALVLVGGLLILVPGFITDVLGLLLILPFTRPVGRRLLQMLVARRVLGAAGSGRVVRGERVPPTYRAEPYDWKKEERDGQRDPSGDRGSGQGPDTPMAPGEPGAIEGKIVRD